MTSPAPSIEAPARRDRSRSMTGGEAVVAALADEGVELMFGIPGTHTLPIYRHLPAAGIRHVTPRNEQGGGYAADGYARASGGLGVIHATTGPGVLNAITPAATAWADSVPLLVLSPALPTAVEGCDTGHLHESSDQLGALAAVVGHADRPTSADAAYRAVRTATSIALSGRPRPVHVAVPLDVLAESGPVERVLPGIRVSGPIPNPTAIEEAVDLLAAAERPLIVAGGGARQAASQVLALAERLGAGVLTTVNGKGIVPESHPLALGASLRLASAKSWLATADVVLAIGTELGESDLWQRSVPIGGVLIRLDVEPAQLHKNHPASVALHTDAQAGCAALLDALGQAPLSREHVEARAAIEAEAARDGAPFAGLCAALERALGSEGLLAADSTMATYYGAVHLLRLESPGRLLYPTGFATLGYGMPAAIGAKLARPDAPVIALSGDGGLMFTIAELACAVEERLALPVVVINNGGYGEIRQQMIDADITLQGVDLHVPDLVALAQAFGAHGERLTSTDELDHALDRALSADTPTLIEIPMARPSR